MSLLGRAVGVVVLRLHEFTEVQGLGGTVRLGTATTSDWLVHLLVVEVAKSLLTKAATSAEVGSVHGGAGAKWHHQALNVSRVDSIFLMHLL